MLIKDFPDDDIDQQRGLSPYSLQRLSNLTTGIKISNDRRVVVEQHHIRGFEDIVNKVQLMKMAYAVLNSLQDFAWILESLAIECERSFHMAS